MLRSLKKVGCSFLCLCMMLVSLPGSAENSDLVELQERLLSLGYEIGIADGILGKKTSSAIALTQILLAEHGYEVQSTGLPDEETVRQIMREENTELLQTLLMGSWGNRVKEAQTKLISLNLLWDSADGTFGANTEAAVISFEEKMESQFSKQIQRDGRLSLSEYNLLMSDLSSYGFEAPIYFDDGKPETLTGKYLFARNACLINAVTGEILLEKDADVPAEPASTTKIVTLLTALSLCDPNEIIVIPDAATDVPADSTLVPVYPGETMSMEDLMYGMIIRSGNDAANAIATLCSGSTEAFAEEMNKMANNIGMKNSHFVNPHGYTAAGHYTTARDLTTVAREGMMHPLFSRIVTCLKYTLPATELRDELILNLKWEIFDPESEFYLPHAAGIKSGYTSSAGFCYVGAWQENGITLIAAVMGDRWRNMAWTDLKRLFAYGMAVTDTSHQNK